MSIYNCYWADRKFVVETRDEELIEIIREGTDLYINGEKVLGVRLKSTEEIELSVSCAVSFRITSAEYWYALHGNEIPDRQYLGMLEAQLAEIRYTVGRQTKSY